MNHHNDQISRITTLLRKVYNSKRIDYNNIAVTYINSVTEAIFTSIIANRNGIYIARTPLRNALGRFGKRAKQTYWRDVLEESEESLYNVLEVGTKIGGQSIISRIAVHNYKQIIETADVTQYIASIHAKLKDESDGVLTLSKLQIDVDNLADYINNNLDDKQRNSTMDRNVDTATVLLRLARACPNNEIPVLKKMSSFGREYHSAPSLQGAPAIIRKAALGPHVTEIDISNAVFTWMYNEVDDYTRTKLKAIANYLEHKESVRSQLAKEIFGDVKNYDEKTSVKTLKTVMTSMGFGGRLNAGSGVYYNKQGKLVELAFAQAVKSPALRQKIIDHHFFSRFVRELNVVKKNILPKYKAQLMQNEELLTTSGKLSHNKAMAWLYQHAEKDIMNKMVNELNLNVVLGVHDGVYVTDEIEERTVNRWMQSQWLMGKAQVKQINKQHADEHTIETAPIELTSNSMLVDSTAYKSAADLIYKLSQIKQDHHI